MSAASIAAEVEGVGGQPVSAQTIRHTLHQIGLCGCRPGSLTSTSSVMISWKSGRGLQWQPVKLW